MGDMEAESRFLLQPQHRIVTLEKHSVTSGNHITLALDKNNLENLIKSISEKYQSYLNFPIAFLSVLGSNKDGLRALHTDWLIHYFEKEGNKIKDTDEIYKSWPTKFSPADQLKYVGQLANAEPGVYIWPTSFDIIEEISTESKKDQHQQLLCFILYAHSDGGQHHDPGCSIILDYLVACVTQKIVTFKPTEKDKIISFVKAMNGNTLPPLTSFIEATRAVSLAQATSRNPGSMATGWDAFVKSLKNTGSILKGKEKASCLPALKRIRGHVESIISKMNAPPQEADTLILNSIAEENSSQKVERKQESIKTAEETSSETIPLEKINTKHIESFRAEFQKWLVEDIKLPKDLRSKLLGTDQWNTIMDKLSILQRIEQGYNLELQNMFDNYVCFSGNLDEKQIIRFQETAREREKSNWTAAQSENNSLDDANIQMIRTGITNWLSTRYMNDNNKIIEMENKLGEKVCRKVAKAYSAQMDKLMSERKLKVSEAQTIHERLLKQCCAMVNRCMDFGGRLNNIARNHITILEEATNDQFEKWRKEKKFSEEAPEQRKISEADGITSTYLKEVDSKMSQYSAAGQLDELHHVTFQKLANGKSGEEREDLDAILQSYLVYASEQYQEQLQHSPSGRGAVTMCVHMTDKWIKVMVRQSRGWKVIQFQQDPSHQKPPPVQPQSALCPAQVSWIKGKFGLGYNAKNTIKRKGKVNEKDFDGTIFNCIRIIGKDNAEMAISILKELFIRLCNLGEVEITDTQVVLIVPSWFVVRDRTLLRRSTAAAGLKKTFFVNESSLAAYSLLVEHKAEKLICVVIARMDAVRIEIFGTHPNSEDKVISMMALAFGECPREGMDLQRLPANFVQVLEAAYDRAIAQLPLDKNHREMVCYLQTDNDDWRPELTAFFLKKHLVLREESKEYTTQENFVDAASAKLCVIPDKMRTLLLDYATKKLEVNVERSGTQMSAEHQELLRKCQIMETQLNNREVRLGVITKKIVMEIIERVRLNVKLSQSTEKEELELEELISMHKFKI